MQECPSDVHPMHHSGSSGRLQVAERPRQLSAMRRAASTPTLRTLGVPQGSPEVDGGMEVYVVLRNFQEFCGGMFSRLPQPIREGVRDSGICHYMTVFRKPDGSLAMFDFGPKAGGDIHVSAGPFASVLSKDPRGRRSARRVDGIVREYKLTSLPPSHMYVGRTHLSLHDIRAWNNVHEAAEYELHRFDCRHYVNSLVRYATGMERATVTALQHQWQQNRTRNPLAHSVVRLAHYVTDAANWEAVKGATQAAAAVLATLTGQQALARLRTAPLVQSMQRRLLPVARSGLTPMRRALVQRPVYTAAGTAAVATLAANGGQAPAAAVRETVSIGARLAGGMQVAARAAANLAQHVGRSASSATQQTMQRATGIAGVATRGAAAMIAARPRAAAVAGGQQGAASPPRATLPSFKASRASQLAIVASRR